MNSKLFQHFRNANYYLFELFVFFRLLALSISSIAISVLIQDKICIVDYNQTIEFCQYIEADVNTPVQIEYRDKVLSEAAIFNNYKNLVECTPMVILSLFVGSFLDNYENGTFVMMFLNVLGDIYSIVVYLLLVHWFDTSPYYLLFASLYVWFTGGAMSFTTTAYRYITLTTDEKNRALKFVVLEIIFVIGLSISIFFGGILLKVQPNAATPRTYSHNFQIALIFDLFAFLTLFALQYVSTNQKRKKESQTTTVMYNIEDDLLKVNNIVLTSYWKNIALDTASDGDSGNKVDIDREEKPKKNILQIMFNLQSAYETIECFLKPREHNFRLLIFLIFIVLFNQVLTSTGINGVLLQFVERAYNWNTKVYSLFVAVSHIVSTVVLAISSIFLVKMLKLEDGSLIVLAQISAFSAYVIIGTFAHPKAYFAAIVVGSLHGYGVICIRTKLSKIIPEDEVGKIFCVSCTLEALVPLVSSIIYSNLFSASISTYPTLIYQFSAFIMLLSIIVMTFEVYYCPVQSRKEIEEIQRMKELRVQQQINGGLNGSELSVKSM